MVFPVSLQYLSQLITILRLITMIAKRKKTFSITTNPIVTVPVSLQDCKQENISVKYFTDAVYHSLTYQVPFSLSADPVTSSDSSSLTNWQIKMNFQFLLSQTKTHKKIFDNIGVININLKNKILRYGILVTLEKGQIFISLIE